VASRVQTGTADFTSTVREMSSFTLAAGADAATVNLRENTVGGEIKYVVKAAASATVHLDFADPVRGDASGDVWFVDLAAGTSPQMTIAGTG
jgi:hypothetical protein